MAGDIPLLVRRGGCGINKKSAQPTLAPQTGWSLTSHVQNAFRNIMCERPPRPLQQMLLRGIFLMSRPPLLTWRGMSTAAVPFVD